MSDQPTGHTEAAEILDTRQETYDEANALAEIVPNGFRVIEISNGDGYHIERETTHGPYWAPVARFTDPDARYEWADEIQAETGDDYRCVVDHTDNEVWLEVQIDE